MNEKLIEKKLREKITKLGGIALKFSSPYYVGMPDRFILLPKGRIAFAEIKSMGKKPTPVQSEAINRLTAMGFIVGIIDTQEVLNNFIHKITEDEI